MPKRHYTIYCDESSKKGKHFSNFYGGALVESRDRQAIHDALIIKLDELNINGELKWTKVSSGYLEKYLEFIKFYFEFIKSGKIKIRIMFTHNYHRPVGLTDEQKDNQYFLLYYQMIKHAFGIKYCNPNTLDRVFFSILLDDVPDTREKLAKFRKYIAGISHLQEFRGASISIPEEQIAEIDSKKHTILQGLDIILGAMHFRLNDLHKEKPTGAARRGKRTIAKERLYKTVLSEVRQIHKNFNIGITTGHRNGIEDRWTQPYRHWVFKPSRSQIDETAAKGWPR